MVWFVKKIDGTCGQCAVLASIESPNKNLISGDNAITISASVGIHGANFTSDVVNIQDALNKVAPEKGGAAPKLNPDGDCGHKTKNAIQHFQIEHFGWKGADGLIEPGKQTLAKLNEILGKKMGNLKSHDLVASRAIQLAMNYVVAAQFNLLAASPALDSKDSSIGKISVFGRESLMRLLNKHFSVDLLLNRRKGFYKIQKQYDRMRQIFMRRGGPWGVAIFDRDPADENWWAYCFSGGYFCAGQTTYHKGKKLRLDSIYLCTKFFDKADCQMQAFIIVHELSHFVAQYGKVTDYAYNRDGSPRGAKLKRLSPELKILNAECYANFAYEAYTGNDPGHFP